MMVWLNLAKRTRLHFIGLLFGCGLAACSCDGAAVAEADYQAKILGNWQGQVAGENETMSFAANGEFMSLVRSGGFISTTLGQGVTGRIRGTWAITGSTITLNIKSTEHENVLNSVAIATIETLKPNALFVKSSTGVTSTSLIGHSGSSTFRLSTYAVSMSLAGSCFSSESAPGPFHHGIRGRGGTIFWATLPSV